MFRAIHKSLDLSWRASVSAIANFRARDRQSPSFRCKRGRYKMPSKPAALYHTSRRGTCDAATGAVKRRVVPVRVYTPLRDFRSTGLMANPLAGTVIMYPGSRGRTS